MKATLEVIRRLRDTATIVDSYDSRFPQFFHGRLVQAFSRPTLIDAIEHLAASLGSSVQYVGGEKVAAFMAEASSPQAPAILRWLRMHPKIVQMLAGLRSDEDFDAAIATIDIGTLPDGEAGSVAAAPAFDIGIRATCLSPLAHGGDQKAGNATLFRRQEVLTPTGHTLSLPVYGGNAFRGQLRDTLADHFLTALGLTPSRTQPPLSLWFFYALYSGGILEEKKAEALAESDQIKLELGKAGAVRTDGHRRIREMVPPGSLLGMILANHPIPGRIFVANLRPRCIEWGTGDRPAAELLGWEFATRREDYEGRGDDDKHTGMIRTVEVLKPGTVLDGGIDIDTHASEIERACLARGLLLMAEHGRLGAENRQGFGKVAIEYENLPDPEPYDAYLAEHREEILDYLAEMGAVHGRDLAHR